jgi:restriction endonuclease S subunit
MWNTQLIFIIMTIGDVCEFKVNFRNADFWLVRKGSEKSVGQPTKEYSSKNIGVKVINRELIDPTFLYYYFMHLHQSGVFVNFAHGTLKLKNIKVSDIKNILISL